MKKEVTQEMIKSIEIAKESFKNSMEITLESYSEVLSRLDLMTYLLMNEKNSLF